MRHYKYLVLVLLAACGGSEGQVGSETLTGSDERVQYAPIGPGGVTSLALNTPLDVSAPVNLREAPAPDARALMVVPEGASVTVAERTDPENGYYRVEYFGRTGWAYGAYLVPTVGSLESGLTDTVKDNVLERARASDGYSYWWGHGKFGCGLGHGSCSGSCPSCSHSGEGGADCSGMVAKAWNVPLSNPGTCTDAHPYSSTDFATASYHWFTISRANIERADAFVLIGGGHVMIRGAGSSAAGDPYILECSGCSAGCITHYRSVSSDYKVIRRDQDL
ncbi:SH3 domain-containing protein [Archangium sp.]|uniref:SH3 domain-containing protein n=1 Tax=Archangium sp. TaxID=1872627 RepID=UPI003899EA3A